MQSAFVDVADTRREAEAEQMAQAEDMINRPAVAEPVCPAPATRDLSEVIGTEGVESFDRRAIGGGSKIAAC